MKMKLLLTVVPVLALVMQITPLLAQQSSGNQKKAIQNTIPRKKETRSSVDIRNVTTDESGETSIDYLDDDHRYKIKMKESKIVGMNIDGKKIPEEDFSKYDATVNKILLQLKKDREQADQDRIQADKDRQQADRDLDQADRDRDQANRGRDQADKDRELAGKQREHAEEDRQRADGDRQKTMQYKRQIQNERDQLERDRIRVTKERERAAMDRRQVEKDREQADHDREQALQDRKQAEHDREQAAQDRKQAELDRKQANEDRKLLEEMINDVVREKIVDNKDAVKSLILDDTELTVNGFKQNDSLHNKFKAKYLKKSGSRINYRNSGGSKGVSID
jgi:chromosome segregation ATPase